MNKCCSKRERNDKGACRHCGSWMPETKENAVESAPEFIEEEKTERLSVLPNPFGEFCDLLRCRWCRFGNAACASCNGTGLRAFDVDEAGRLRKLACDLDSIAGGNRYIDRLLRACSESVAHRLISASQVSDVIAAALGIEST